jgi:hypothetical protein
MIGRTSADIDSTNREKIVLSIEIKKINLEVSLIDKQMACLIWIELLYFF